MTAAGTRTSIIQFADGSTAEISGKVSLFIVLGTPEGPRIHSAFYVLDDLTSNIVLGESFLAETKAFEEYRNAFPLIECDNEVAQINAIVWFNAVEFHVARRLQNLDPTSKTAGKTDLPYCH